MADVSTEIEHDAIAEADRQRRARLRKRATQLDVIATTALAQRRALERAIRGGTPAETAADRRIAEGTLAKLVRDART